MLDFNKAKSRAHPGPPPYMSYYKRGSSERFQEWYKKYLASDDWKIKREAVLQRAGGFCEGCRSRMATQVHHLTYQHVGYEYLWELVAICRPCHDRLHKR